MTVTRAEVLQSLKLKLQQISKEKSPIADAVEVVSTGVAGLDKLLPQRGIPRGGMVEWLVADFGAGAVTLALAGVREALGKTANGKPNENGSWVVIDPLRQFFPPAALGWGILPERLLLVQPASERDAAWAFEQALRCPGVAVTWNWIGAVTERMLQRWKVAAEAGGGQGVLFRSDRALKQPAWADVRWLVQPLADRETADRETVRYRAGHETASRRFRLQLVYCRGALGGDQVDVECNDETGLVRVVPQLADSAPRVFAARA